MCCCIGVNYGWGDQSNEFVLLCPCSIENSSASDRVFRAVEEALQKSPFSFQGARILSGQEEGAFGWVTVNYLDDRLKQVCAHTRYMSVHVCPPLHMATGEYRLSCLNCRA